MASSNIPIRISEEPDTEMVGSQAGQTLPMTTRPTRLIEFPETRSNEELDDLSTTDLLLYATDLAGVCQRSYVSLGDSSSFNLNREAKTVADAIFKTAAQTKLSADETRRRIITKIHHLARLSGEFYDRMVSHELVTTGLLEENARRQEETATLRQAHIDRKSTRLNSSHSGESRMPSSA